MEIAQAFLFMHLEEFVSNLGFFLNILISFFILNLDLSRIHS